MIRKAISLIALALVLCLSGERVDSEGISSGAVVGGIEGIFNPGATGTPSLTPTVTAVSPNSGSTAGGTTVTITGTKFTGATVVDFGPSNPASFSVTNSTTIVVASSPSGSAGTVDVTVTTPNGTSATSASDHFTYTTVGACAGVIDFSAGCTLPMFGGL